jgi:hypothetical protein
LGKVKGLGEVYGLGKVKGTGYRITRDSAHNVAPSRSLCENSKPCAASSSPVALMFGIQDSEFRV